MLKIAILIGLGFLGLCFLWVIWMFLSLHKRYTEKPPKKKPPNHLDLWC
jgi:uncharacterized membrane protein